MPEIFSGPFLYPFRPGVLPKWSWRRRPETLQADPVRAPVDFFGTCGFPA